MKSVAWPGLSANSASWVCLANRPPEVMLRVMEAGLTAERTLTYEEERGKPIPSRNHAVIEGNLHVEFAKHREFHSLPEATIELVPGKSLVPDLSVFPRRPIDLQRDVIRTTEPPLLAVEIVSPAQALDEIVEKAEFYLANGVKSVWIVIPPLHQITIVLPDGSQQSYHEGVVNDPATGITADLSFVFS